MNLLPYPEYKDSGVEWLGNVPSHWSATPLFTLFRRGKQLGEGSETLLSVYRDYGVVPKASRDDNFNKASEDLSKYQRVEPGDLVINKMKAWQGSVAVSTLSGIVSPAYFVFKPQAEMRLRFMHYLMRSNSYFQFYASISTGVRPNQWDLDPEQHKRLPVVFPSLDEQQAIADYLDHETAEIDAFIADQNELIGLLNERRAATITQAVTKGLDPNAPMKDSGVEWLGEIPADWRATPLKFLSDMQTGVTLGKTFGDDAVNYPYLRVANVQIGYVDLTNLKTISIPADLAASSMLRAGDVLMTEGGDRDKLGRGCIWTAPVEPCLHQNHIFAVRCTKGLGNRFLVYVLESSLARRYFHVTGKQTTNLAATNSTLVKNFRFGIPEPSEQQSIADYLDHETAEIGAAITDAKEAIKLSKERRAALISAAVTGKIDVRDHERAKGTA